MESSLWALRGDFNTVASAAKADLASRHLCRG
jgi:hypothetical protein